MYHGHILIAGLSVPRGRVRQTPSLFSVRAREGRQGGQTWKTPSEVPKVSGVKSGQGVGEDGGRRPAGQAARNPWAVAQRARQAARGGPVDGGEREEGSATVRARAAEGRTRTDGPPPLPEFLMSSHVRKAAAARAAAAHAHAAAPAPAARTLQLDSLSLFVDDVRQFCRLRRSVPRSAQPGAFVVIIPPWPPWPLRLRGVKEDRVSELSEERRPR